ncbi:MAG: hypothetical protein HRT72_00055 [Flavobacteriales bacterium]|nr:hypothetical protein [Flavobacteriales bacterium]
MSSFKMDSTGRIFTLKYKGSSLIEIWFVESYRVHISDLMELEEVFLQQTNKEERYSLIVIPGRFGGMAEEYKGVDMLEPFKSRIDKLAIIAPVLRIRLLGRAYFNFITKPVYDYKFFKNELLALTWLN